MGEARKPLAGEKTCLPDIVARHPKRPILRSLLATARDYQARRLAMKAKAIDSGMRV